MQRHSHAAKRLADQQRVRLHRRAVRSLRDCAFRNTNNRQCSGTRVPQESRKSPAERKNGLETQASKPLNQKQKSGAAGRNRTHDPLVRSLLIGKWGQANQRLSGALTPHFASTRSRLQLEVAQKSRNDSQQDQQHCQTG